MTTERYTIDHAPPGTQCLVCGGPADRLFHETRGYFWACLGDLRWRLGFAVQEGHGACPLQPDPVPSLPRAPGGMALHQEPPPTRPFSATASGWGSQPAAAPCGHCAVLHDAVSEAIGQLAIGDKQAAIQVLLGTQHIPRPVPPTTTQHAPAPLSPGHRRGGQ